MIKKIGPTGEYPQGRLGPDDEGALRIGIATDDGNVIIAFGTEVSWIGLPPEQAIIFASKLMEHAKAIITKREGGGNG